MSITRDMLKKSYTHVKELQGLQGVAVRKLGTKEAVEKAFQDFFDEYADRKYLVKDEKLNKTINDLSEINKKILEENCKLNTKNHDLESIVLDKNAIISEMKTENNKLRTQLQESDKKEMKLNEDIEELCKLNDSLLDKIKKLSPKWWEFWKW